VRSSYGLVLFTLQEECFSAGLMLLPTRKAAFLFRRWVVRAVEVEGFGFGPGAERCFVNGEWNVEEGGVPVEPLRCQVQLSGSCVAEGCSLGNGRGCHHRKGASTAGSTTTVLTQGCLLATPQSSMNLWRALLVSWP
jgi:hypothetical protein